MGLKCYLNILVWEKKFTKKFNQWMDNQNYHEVIVGGNLWFNYQFKKLRFQDLRFAGGKPMYFIVYNILQ